MDRLETIRKRVESWEMCKAKYSCDEPEHHFSEHEDIPFLLDEVAKLKKQLEVAVGALNQQRDNCACEMPEVCYDPIKEALYKIEAIGKEGGGE